MNEPEHATPQLTTRECLLGRIYVPLHIIVIPVLLSVYRWVTNTSPDPMRLNGIYYALGIAWTLLFLRGYLRRTLDPFFERPGWCLATAFSGFLFNFAITWLLGMLALWLGGEATTPPNNEAVGSLLTGNPSAALWLVCVVAPVVEETLFRGAVFAGAVARGRRLTGYLVSVLLFALYHVWSLPLSGYGLLSLLYAVAYIPAGFILARCYEMTGSLWTSILLHAAINACAASVLLG